MPLYFAYWDGDYTNVTENRDIVAVYTPLVKLITYDKTGSTPDVPVETMEPYLSTPNLTPKPPNDGYSAAWFLSDGGEVLSDNPFDQPCLEDMEIEEYEYTYIRFTDLTFTLQQDQETSCQMTYTLFCSPCMIEAEEEEEAEENKETYYRYILCIPLSPEEEAMAPLDLAVADNAAFTIVFDDLYEVPLEQFSFWVTMGGEESELIPYSDLISLLEYSSATPLLITGAEAELELELETTQ